jgi:ubiquinone/menaquinone biosynthesis C-methylase UbiE
VAHRQVDYDGIAPTYNRRYADSELSNVAIALRMLAERLAAERAALRVLEVGCGTGHWLAGLRQVTARLHGLDFSAGMLAQACQRTDRLFLTQGRASQLPHAEGSFDLVCCVNAIHHFRQPGAFVPEAQRLLRPGGALAVIGMDPNTLPNRWYVYDYFEGTLEADLARFPSWGTVLDWMIGAGFERAAWRLVEWVHDPRVGRAVLDDPFLRKDAVSQLALLSDGAYAAGLDRIRTALAKAEADGRTLTFPSDITLAMLVGWRPE